MEIYAEYGAQCQIFPVPSCHGRGFPRGFILRECNDEAEAPDGWTKWRIPGYEYIYVECEGKDVFQKVLEYLKDNGIPLVGAVQDFTSPQTGKNYMYFPIKKL